MPAANSKRGSRTEPIEVLPGGHPASLGSALPYNPLRLGAAGCDWFAISSPSLDGRVGPRHCLSNRAAPTNALGLRRWPRHFSLVERLPFGRSIRTTGRVQARRRGGRNRSALLPPETIWPSGPGQGRSTPSRVREADQSGIACSSQPREAHAVRLHQGQRERPWEAARGYTKTPDLSVFDVAAWIDPPPS